MPILSLTSTFIVSHQLLFAFNVTKPILFGGYRCGACPPNRPKGTINYQLTSILYDFGGISSQIQALLSYKYPLISLGQRYEISKYCYSAIFIPHPHLGSLT